MSRRIKQILFTILFILLTPLIVYSATYYVDSSCGASGNGTTATCGASGPWKTLAEAASGVPNNANHTISVKAGTYAGNFTDSRNGITPGYRYWLANGTVQINGMVTLSGDYIKFEGFSITGGSWTVVDLVGNYEYFLNNTIHDSPRTGIWLDINSTGSTVEGNTLIGCDSVAITLIGTYHTIKNNDISGMTGASDSDGIHFFGSGHLIQGNYYHNYTRVGGNTAHVDCFQTWDQPGVKPIAHNVTFDGNHCFMGHDSDGTLAPRTSDSTSVTGWMLDIGYDITIKNNVIEACEAINAYSGGHHLYIYNNTFRGIANFTSYNPRGIILGTSSHDVAIHNNILVDFRTAYIDLEGAANTTHDYNIMYSSVGSEPGTPIWYGSVNAHEKRAVDPKFVTYPPSIPILKNPTAYQLQYSSPAIDAGITLSSVTNDYEGILRPQGTGCDIGPFEYHDSLVSPPGNLRIVP